MSPVRFLFSLSLYSSGGAESIGRSISGILRNITHTVYFLHIIPFTWICWQVLEVHWLADLSVRGPPELHPDFNWFGEVSVTVGGCAEHNGHLPVDVSLGKSALPLPGILEETHLDVLFKETENEKCNKKK